jgi:Holliday junction resolvase-like predicted endonuclease
VHLKKQNRILHATQVFISQHLQYKNFTINFAVIAFENGKLMYYEADLLW